MLNGWQSLARSQVAVALAGLVALEIPFAALHQLGNLKLYVVETIATGLAAGLIYFVALYALEHSTERRATFWLVLAGALLFRLTLLPLPPTLSTDLYRYLWDGRIQSASAHWNPYTVRPDDPRLAKLCDQNWSAVSGPDIAAIYPPLVELVYRATYRVLPSPAGFKLPFLMADLLVIGLLAGWIRSSGGRSFQLAVYAWNPLVVVEFAASGHNDALALAAVVAASLVIIRWRGMLSMLLLTAGMLLKWFPAVLFPLWLRRAGWPRNLEAWGKTLAAVGLAVLCAWPFRSAWPQILETLDYYQSRWHHNNASLYALLAWVSGSRELAEGMGVGVVAGLALWVASRQMDGVRAAYILFGAILMLTPNAFSWYFTWMVPLLCFFPNPAWLLLTVLQFLSYHVLIDYQAKGLWRFRPEMLWLTYAPCYAWLLWQAARAASIRGADA